MAMYPHLHVDYASPDFHKSDLEGFDAVVFSAGKDPRDLEKGSDAEAFWNDMNVQAVPRFFEMARDAGVRRIVNVGTFYPWVAPHLAGNNPYIRSRQAVDQLIHGLNSSSFDVISVNPPYIVGFVRGLASRGSFDSLVRYARGSMPEIEIYAPSGGVHFMCTQSLSEAIEGALLKGEPGRSYLVGDQDFSYHDYFQAYFRAAGRDIEIPVRNQSHPLLGSFAGVGGTLYYEPDPAAAELLGYRRQDVLRAIGEVVQHCA